MDKTPRVFWMMGHAHIDPVWLWPWTEGCAEVLATYRSALDRMKEFPDWVLAASSAAFLNWVEEIAPEMLPEIRARVEEGRWLPVGGWWIEPDCNIPSVESFARQALYGQRTFRRLLGKTAVTGFAPDSFGHHAMLPQLLQGAGLKNYVFMRPAPHEKPESELPGWLFTWQAPDGSRVRVYRIPHSYNGEGDEVARRLDMLDADNTPYPLLVFYGVGNHGGGPTKRTLRLLSALAERYPLVHGSIDEYFEAVAPLMDKLPVVRDELQHHARGCYSAVSAIKALNRRAEQALLNAERWNAAALMLGGPGRFGELDGAWQTLLFNQFHDILAGSSLARCYVDARDQLGGVIAQADASRNRCQAWLAGRMAVAFDEDTLPFAVFNPHGHEVETWVEMESFHAIRDAGIVDESGSVVPSQPVANEAIVMGERRLGFMARVPALGWRVYRIKPGTKTGGEPLPATDTCLENEFWRLTVDPDRGCIASLVDKATGENVFTGPAAVPTVYEDTSDTWSHDVVGWDQPLAVFGGGESRLIEAGPLRCRLLLKSRWQDAEVTQVFTLYRGVRRIDVRVEVDWRGHNKLLKLRFPVNAREPVATWEIPGGIITRATAGQEEPMGRWVDASSGARGLTILNDGKHGGDVRGADIGLTVLRCPPYAHHNPRVLKPDETYAWTDQGVQTFRYALLPHLGGCPVEEAMAEADLLNAPLQALPTHFHDGALAARGSLITLSGEGMALLACKPAQDGGAIILRLQQRTGRTAKAHVALAALGREITADFGPWQIRTFRVPLDSALPVAEVNLLEWTPEEMA